MKMPTARVEAASRLLGAGGEDEDRPPFRGERIDLPGRQVVSTLGLDMRIGDDCEAVQIAITLSSYHPADRIVFDTTTVTSRICIRFPLAAG
jgi:hypothetical protein